MPSTPGVGFDDVVSEGSMTAESRALEKRASNWHVTLKNGNRAWLSHAIADDEGPIWAGEVELWRGAPSFDSHPEIRHGLLAMMNPLVHREFVRHFWEYDIPDNYLGLSNSGANHRRYFILRAYGGEINWTLVLRLPVDAPQFVWKAIAEAFGATLKETPMHPAGPDQTAKSAMLQKGPVPTQTTQAPPPAAKEGISSLTSGNK